MYREILYTVDDPVATITLNRPEFLNGWTQRMSAEFRHAVAQAEDDPAVVGIVITGAGRAFCAGADMGTLSTIRDGRRLEDDLSDLVVERSEPLPAEFDGEFTRLLVVKKPVIAAINGAIAGMAVPLALCCDLRFMAADAPLRTAFAQRGLIAEWGISWLLPRVVGTGHALDLLFSPRRVTGQEAAAMGLVNAAMPAEEVVAHSQRYVTDLAASCSPAFAGGHETPGVRAVDGPPGKLGTRRPPSYDGKLPGSGLQGGRQLVPGKAAPQVPTPRPQLSGTTRPTERAAFPTGHRTRHRTSGHPRPGSAINSGGVAGAS